ncbi:hypothetical protein LCGC14_1756460 [marine sediment metagenome]|uniref:Uncharacterized protein n=1 Tax=marine sediment metagenome TaxID=412755 RepID=A0A0F9K1X4_9ZZZZ
MEEIKITYEIGDNLRRILSDLVGDMRQTSSLRGHTNTAGTIQKIFECLSVKNPLEVNKENTMFKDYLVKQK